MVVDFSKLEEKVMPEFKGGQGNFCVKTSADELTKIMMGRLEPGASIGYHKHETNCEMIYILSGEATYRYDDTTETAVPGQCHYCPKGHSHSMTNYGTEELVFLAIVPEQ